MDKNPIEMYSFFTYENYQEKKEIFIQIDDTFETFEDICNYIGESLYKDCPDQNGIISGTYFGGNFSSFFDCLDTFLLYDKREISLRFNIIKIGNYLPDKEIYRLLDGCCFSKFHCDKNNKLQVYVSKDIMEIYLKESQRLLTLDIAPEDELQLQVGERV